MSVYLFRATELEYPIVFDKDTNSPDMYLLHYAICKKNFPHLVNRKLTRKCKEKAIIDALQRICYLINRLSEQKQLNGELGGHYLAATYSGNMEPLIRAMRYEGGWKGESIEQYVKTWRQFYSFLSLQGIHHNMYMPETIAVTISEDQNDNFLSHTVAQNNFSGEIETAVDSSWFERKDDYKESILSIEQFWLLYASLHEIDPVYAAMAYTQLVTCLRVTALINCYPRTKNNNNPHWLSYKEMKRDNITKQPLNYIAKGGSMKQLQAPISLMKVVYDIYDQPETGASYGKRLNRFQKEYSKTKWALNKGVTSDTKPVWLKENGTPVSVRDFQSTMQKCSENIGFYAHPHVLRHTGVTQMLYQYMVNNNLLSKFNHTNQYLLVDAHIILQSHLGHAKVSTTKRYLRTIERIIQESNMDILLNTTLSTSRQHADMLKNNPQLMNGMKVLEEAILGATAQTTSY